MIGILDYPFGPGETDRYEACPLHRAALDRISYQSAWDFAAYACDDCIAEVRT